MDGIINVYKEKGYTSHDVVAKMRGILRMKKIGHTGTLDPAAEGVLPVCLGKGTRLCDMLTDKTKFELEDAGPYESCENGNSFFLTERDGGKYLEYVKRYEPIRGEKMVYVIIRVNQEALFSNLLTGGEDAMIESYLLTRDGQTLSVGNSRELSGDLREHLMGLSEPVQKYKTKTNKLVLYKMPSQISDIALVAVQDYT